MPPASPKPSAAKTKTDGTTFHVAFAGVQLKPDQAARVNAAVQSAVMAELAALDFKGDLQVSQVANGRTAGGANVGTAVDFEEWCGTPYPGFHKHKLPGRGGGDVLPRPIINGIIIREAVRNFQVNG